MPNFLNNKSANNHHYLSASECLNLLNDQQKQELFEHKVDLVFEPNETIVKRGILADNVLYLTEGLVKLEIINDSKPSTIGLTQAHSFIGIACCFAFNYFDFTATSLIKTNVSFIPMPLFEKFIKENGEFALSLIKHISGVSNGIFHRITSLSQKNIEGALAMILLDFAAIYKSNSYELPVGRSGFADILGYSKESVINTLSKYNKEGIIKVDDRNIEILNAIKLEQISKFG
jgi:CRP-like cAMP-binding protein